jgi:acylglycerol lipase
MRPRTHRRCTIAITLSLCLAACATPHLQQAGSHRQAPALRGGYAVMDDGYRLPMRVWRPRGNPCCVVLALHGFNDYSNAFASVGPAFAAYGIITYAYDQRGFGATAQRGLWPGAERLVDDLTTMARLVRQAHPQLPLYLLGESMGGAVVMRAVTEERPLSPAGIVLIAPAVWGRNTMPFLQRAALWVGVHTVPQREVTAKGLDITPSDNKEMLRALGRDPLVIKRTRIDTLYGLTNLMDAALAASPSLATPALVLYGKHDEIIPRRPTCRMLAQFSPSRTQSQRLAVYPNGYHMLTRDLQSQVVLADIATWIRDPDAPLPSGEEIDREETALPDFCKGRL